jgi:hypothetical protein
LGESRLVDTELDASTKLGATEVANTELIDAAELAGDTQFGCGSARRAQQQRMDVGGSELAGNTRLSSVSCAESW